MSNKLTRSRLPVPPSGTLIFEGAGKGSARQKATTLSIAVVCWTAWLTLWAPLATYGFWALAPLWGVRTVLAAGDESLPVLALLSATGLALGAALVLAGALQWARGSNRERPRVRPSVTLAELASAHRVAEPTLQASWAAQRVVLHHNADSTISRIELS